MHLLEELLSLHSPPNVRIAPGPVPGVPVEPQAPLSVAGRAKLFFKTHGRKLWWMHSFYALALGIGVVFFARQGFEHARWMAILLGLAWLLLVLVFRVTASGAAVHAYEAPDTKTRVRFFVMTYALKNLYQGMLFFLLPFYWKSMTGDSANVWFCMLLGACAVLSTIDIVFDRVLMRFRWLASGFHGFTLFACLNLVIPALFPDTRTLVSLLAAAAIAVVSFWTLHTTMREMKKKLTAGLFGLTLCAGVGLAYVARAGVPPVPMYVSSAGVGPKQLGDGRLAMEVKTLHPEVIQELIGLTDVVVPGGKGDRLRHVWRHEGAVVRRTTEETSKIAGPKGVVRLRSSLTAEDLPKDLLGKWSVDVETDDGQLVGRTEFEVVE
jgi:hypothetical protein